MSVADFLHCVREVVRLLAISPGDRLIDIGCGSGLFCLALADRVSAVDAFDISPVMVDRAQRNTSGIANVTVSVAGFPDLGHLKHAYEKLLAYSVLQYLSDEAEVFAAFKETARLLKSGGLGLFACNSDPSRRNDYLSVIRKTMTPAEYEENVELINRTLWVDKNRLLALAEKAGLKAAALPISDRIWQHFYMFDFLVVKP